MRKKDKLRAYWSKRENDLMLHYPLGTGTSSDAHWLSGIFDDKFTQSIKDRGYDPETIKFEVCPQQGHQGFASERKETVDIQEESALQQPGLSMLGLR